MCALEGGPIGVGGVYVGVLVGVGVLAADCAAIAAALACISAMKSGTAGVLAADCAFEILWNLAASFAAA